MPSMIILDLELLSCVVMGCLIGWFARFYFVQCNKYRMLKRLVAWNEEIRRDEK